MIITGFLQPKGVHGLSASIWDSCCSIGLERSRVLAELGIPKVIDLFHGIDVDPHKAKAGVFFQIP